MSEHHSDEIWHLYRQVVRERDTARAELDTLRLMTLEAIRERDEARALGHECLDLLRHFVQSDGRLHSERWEELDRLHDRLRPMGWLHEPPALSGGAPREQRCPACGLSLSSHRSCPLCGPPSVEE